ncbi:alkylhydroperoxidase AhpD family core domain-containing protein [Thermoanaerobacter thermohydrosulfuricus]|uniref:Alkylhydroperoxidase like protein, AhpD family n=5 Tax=Thermoanaerobacter TaxID=1754 RepID=B0K854_THEP3|nr:MULTISPECIES: carboxymuconolactone decarboxylase family protein [Thermoanaerobacter]EGD50996.1 alkylhydroperoxidase like protein, AhpD family [Thermoanaerobacter ethanolicus JW 200]HHW58165.1 carboxymuconolactone decarboxylase family protein [Clostridia bacterium]ABY94367.1 alkylhydroperoxidase like protein, AhpD family [Thermoanaerobacter pseudethanolicus ATCC 33223]ADV79319.1 alkylhydroperoxidase like protein, AhpD family [Thermoanaerobacter brockii subsp. finnii Ako-1]EIW00425.1 alkylhyd
MSEEKANRIYDVKTFYKFVEDLLTHGGQPKPSKKVKLSKDFMERIMLAVTQVNGCPYCSYFHAKEALKSGMSKEEIKNLLNGEFGDVPEDQVVALMFAEHYAETAGHPDPDAYKRLLETYGEDYTYSIMNAIRAIMVGNTHGNAFHALRRRLGGKPLPNSTLGNELGVVFGIFVFVPVILIKQLFRRKN